MTAIASHPVNVTGPFADALHRIMREACPLAILETGTYDGLGSTLCIASAMAPKLARFYSIEADAGLAETARRNLFGWNVRVLTGLSLRREQLPDAEEIARVCEGAPVVDHQPQERVARYLAEQCSEGPDGLMAAVIRDEFAGRPDLVLLDSAGHLGWLEFQEAMRLIKERCLLALDDTNHVKHYKSRQHMREHPARFRILAEGEDRSGWVIAQYLPA